MATSTRAHAHHSHGHDAGADRPKGFHDPKVAQDAEHIKEHYEGRAELDEEKMTPEELEFHYFKLHDFDNNTKLDGLEIFQALTHLLPYENKDKKQVTPEQKHEELKYYTDIIDSVFEEDDIDNDGYLTYVEFVLARQREEANAKQHQQHQQQHQQQQQHTEQAQKL